MEQRGNSAGWRKQIGVIFSPCSLVGRASQEVAGNQCRRSVVRFHPRRQNAYLNILFQNPTFPCCPAVRFGNYLIFIIRFNTLAYTPVKVCMLSNKNHLLKYKHMTKQSIMDDQEVRYILRQLGIGAAIGAAFLMTLYLGGIVAHLVSGF